MPEGTLFYVLHFLVKSPAQCLHSLVFGESFYYVLNVLFYYIRQVNVVKLARYYAIITVRL